MALAPPTYIVPLEHSDSDPRPEILVDVGGHTLKALIDTGAPHNYVFIQNAVLGLDFVARKNLWILNSSRIVVMQFPPRPTPAPSY